MSDLDKMSYAELVAHRAGIDKLLAERRDTERRAGIDQILKIMADLDITVDDLKPARRASAAVKFRDPQTGETWSGRGKAPKWIADKDREQFRIKQD